MTSKVKNTYFFTIHQHIVRGPRFLGTVYVCKILLIYLRYVLICTNPVAHLFSTVCRRKCPLYYLSTYWLCGYFTPILGLYCWITQRGYKLWGGIKYERVWEDMRGYDRVWEVIEWGMVTWWRCVGVDEKWQGKARVYPLMWGDVSQGLLRI